uniref:Putative solute carrier family 35 member c2 n=1 Tax=Tabanus bromius TaxID=304241 RepID=A0A0K8TQP9_TABBR
MTVPKYERLCTNREQNITNEEEIELGNEQVKIETTSKRHPKSKIIHLAIGTLGLITLYLSLSICLTFYQRWLLQKTHFPLTVVSYHLIIKFIMSACARWLLTLTSNKPRVVLDVKTSLKKMAPIGLASGIDIGFSNWGLELVQISLYTMTKSTTIIFILFFAIILGLEKKSWSLVTIVVMIASGLFMFTYKSTQFDVVGFLFLLLASFTSGIRWSFAQLIMQKSKLGLHNPVDMMFHMQPWMLLSVLPLTFAFEGKNLLEISADIAEKPANDIMLFVAKVTTGAVIAFFMEVSEFLVLSYTSSLTLSIAGIFKDIFQLVLAVEFNGDQIALINVLGLALCLGGICCHVIHKYTMFTKAKNEDISFSADRDIRQSDASTNVKYRKHSAQNVPLLESADLNNSDSELSHEDNPNSSEVLFDVLKRRDATRR